MLRRRLERGSAVPHLRGVVDRHQLLAMQESVEQITVCWRLSADYHNTPGGHIRIYSDKELIGKLVNAGMVFEGKDHAHGLHAPYWWIKCAVGVTNDDNPLVKAYHQVLVWDIMRTRGWSTLTRGAEKALNPLIGKSMVLYLRKPEAPASATVESSAE